MLKIKLKPFIITLEFVFLSCTCLCFIAVVVFLLLNIAGVFVNTLALSIIASIAAAMTVITMAVFLYKGAESCAGCINDCLEKKHDIKIVDDNVKHVLSNSYLQSMFPEERVNIREAVNKKSNESFARAMSISPIRYKHKTTKKQNYGTWAKDFVRKERVLDDAEKEGFLESFNKAP